MSIISGDRFKLNHWDLKFPTNSHRSSFVVIYKKHHLLDITSDYHWFFRTNDGDNNKFINGNFQKNVISGFWEKIEEEIPEEFRIKINNNYLYNGLLDDLGDRLSLEEDDNIFHVKKEKSLLNYELTNKKYFLVFSYEKLVHKIKEGLWIILS